MVVAKKNLPAMGRKTKCDAKGDCGPLELVLAMAGRAGLYRATIYRFWKDKEGKQRSIILPSVIHRTRPSDPGLLLEFCPWCGTNLAELREAVAARLKRRNAIRKATEG